MNAPHCGVRPVTTSRTAGYMPTRRTASPFRSNSPPANEGTSRSLPAAAARGEEFEEKIGGQQRCNFRTPDLAEQIPRFGEIRMSRRHVRTVAAVYDRRFYTFSETARYSRVTLKP